MNSSVVYLIPPLSPKIKENKRESNETHQTLFEGERKGGDGNIMVWVNLIKVHCIHI
jgi:hypothetical protein